MALLADAGHNLQRRPRPGPRLGSGSSGGRSARRRPGGPTACAARRCSRPSSTRCCSSSRSAGIAWEAVRRMWPLRRRCGSGTLVMAVAGVGFVVNGRDGASLLARSPARPQRLAARSCTWPPTRRSRSASSPPGCVLSRTTGWRWIDPAVSLVIVGGDPGRHLEPSTRVARPHARRRPRGRSTSTVYGRTSPRCPASPACSDLHVWGMSTSETWGSRPTSCRPRDTWPRTTSPAPHRHRALRSRFAIAHVTVQATSETLMTPCDGAVVAAPAAQPASHAH